jgi:hypothetical protein
MMSGISEETTLGISPKVFVPALAASALAVALASAGALLDKPRIRNLALGVIASTFLITALGYRASPGYVVAPDYDVTDMHENESVASNTHERTTLSSELEVPPLSPTPRSSATSEPA